MHRVATMLHKIVQFKAKLEKKTCRRTYSVSEMSPVESHSRIMTNESMHGHAGIKFSDTLFPLPSFL